MTKRICNILSSLSGLRAGGLAGAIGRRSSRGASAPRAALELRRRIAVSLPLLVLSLFLLFSESMAAVNGDRIVNRATFTCSELPEVATKVTVTVMARTSSNAEFLKYSPGVADASSITVPATSFYDTTGTLAKLAAPVTAGTESVIDLSTPVLLDASDTFHAGEPLFVRITDPDQNLDHQSPENVQVTVTDAATGDSEVLLLAETGPDTGVFIGYIQTTSQAGLSGNGVLSVAEASDIKAQYVDKVDGGDSSAAAAIVDPFGIIFDSVTGRPVDGVTVELIDPVTGLGATVLGDNGLAGNLYPSKVVSGGIVHDSEGRTYAFSPGGYRFPYVAPGNYILKVTPPEGYTAPSTVDTVKLQALPGAPFKIVERGSFGKDFEVPSGPAIRVDIPIDPKIGTLWLKKSAAKSVVSTGEYLSYDITVQNTDAVGTVFNTVITDKLPAGFRYQKGSVRLNGSAVADPAISPDGGTLTFGIGDLAPKSTALLRYVVVVGTGAKPGTAVNVASAASTPAVSATPATASVTVQEPFMQSRNIIMGRVFVGTCGENPEDNKKGMEGVGIYLEDGTFVVSDKRGMFHFEGVASGTHVVQLDLDSLPEGYQVQQCEKNSRFAGRAYSQFAELQGGTMWRTDFYLSRLTDKAATADAVPANATTSVSTGSTAAATAPASAPTPAAVMAAPATAAHPASPAATTVTAAPAAAATADAALKSEHVQLYSALNEGVVYHRIRLAGIDEALRNVTVNLTLPKSLLYMNGTSRLCGKETADPTATDTDLIYHFDKLPEDGKIDLRLQSLLDPDVTEDDSNASVTIQLCDSDGKPLKTLNATAELSDNMEEINRPDVAPQPQAVAVQSKTPDENSADFEEKVTKGKTDTGETKANDLHVTEKEGILSLANGTVLASQINAVQVVLNSALTPTLILDGQTIPADKIGFKLKDRESDKSLYTFIGLDFGDKGEHILQLKGTDDFGTVRFDQSVKVIRTGEIASLRLVSADGNVADGRTPVMVRIELMDQDGKPVPANAQLTLKGGELHPYIEPGTTAVSAGSGLATVDAQGWIKFQPVTASGAYRTQLSYNKATLDVETYVKPKMRDWILVGLAEGTVGYNTVTGHMENLREAGEEEHLYDDERLAFYAKGSVKGEWLLTMSYDSAKKSTGPNGSSLFQNIDPNAFYTLYGDATAQAYDASSQRKIFLKVERDQFSAVLGDFDTGLSITELSRYSRRLNGVKTEYRSRAFEVTAFGSETGQSFVKDELRGDGTSGLYRLSHKGLVINSEQITIESRDRFHSERVIDSRALSRFIDYSIDYEAGTIFFKSPVFSKDDQLNPVYIVVDYEVSDAGGDALTYGGRAGVKLMDGDLRIGGSYLREGHISGDSTLYGADAGMNLGKGTKARAEVATSRRDMPLDKDNGNAYLAEITHIDQKLEGKAYYREQQEGFGLGQQKGTEAGTRKFGAEGSYRLSEKSTLESQFYRQYNLVDDSVRNFVEAQAAYANKEFTAKAGMSYANDVLTGGNNATSVLGTVGGSWKTLNQRLTLRADHEQALLSKNDNADYPTRTVLGADFQMIPSLLLFAQHEVTSGNAADTNTTRVGMKSTPWSGGTFSSSVGNDREENDQRTFATVGLAQKWQVNSFWSVDGGVDRSQTIRRSGSYQFDAKVPSASGGEDFNAVSLGATYQEKKILWSNRVEYRDGESEDKWGVVSGLTNEQGLYWGWTGKLQVLHTKGSDGSRTTDADLRLGMAYRPPVTRWIVLDRLDLTLKDAQTSGSAIQGKRIVNNLNANFRPDKRNQLSLQYGVKYVLEQLDDDDFSGVTDLLGIEARHDLSATWDIGVRSSVLHGWQARQVNYSLGASVGCNIMQNAWLSLGYNLLGFRDADFSAANYAAAGPFVQFRFKFDQNSVKEGLAALNRGE